MASDAKPQVSGPVDVGIVPHTHWDREWYAPFQAYRLQLVHVVDDLLDLLEGDPAYERFLLDGQTVVVDDYLEVRPDAEARLARLVADGRIQIGPWMVLMDEFMVSGETLVRDLQLGIATRDAARRRDGRRLPPGHVRPRGADATDPAARRARARGGVARRARRHRSHRVLVAGARRLARARRVPLRLVLERAGAAVRPRAARRAGAQLRARGRRRRRCPEAACC